MDNARKQKDLWTAPRGLRQNPAPDEPPESPIVSCPRCGRQNRLKLRPGPAVQRCGACASDLPRSRVILCDVSSSMSEPAGERLKIEILREALDDIFPAVERCILIAFSSHARRLKSPADLPAPYGGTALDLGIAAAVSCAPERTLVISDGRPNSEEAALAAAQHLTGVIDVIYVGPDDDLPAIEFMNQLARGTSGRVISQDLSLGGVDELLSAIRSLLLPEAQESSSPSPPTWRGR